MPAILREYPAPADFFANAESGLVFPNLRNALFSSYTVANDATALLNEFNRGGPASTLIYGPGKVINSLTSAGTLVTVVTVTAHGMATGRAITVSGCTPAAYNGDYAITSVNSTTYTYVAGSAPGAATVVGIYSPHPVYTANDAALTGNVASPAAGINTGIVVADGDVMVHLLAQKAGSMTIFGSSVAAANSNVLGFRSSSTALQFHNNNSAGQSANMNYPADVGTKKLYAMGWGRRHGFPHMVVGLNGVLSGVVSGSTAGGDRVITPGDGVWSFANPTGGSGAVVCTMGAIFNRMDDEASMLVEAQTVYDNLRLKFPGLVY